MEITGYRKIITELTQDLAKLEVYAGNLGMENSEHSLRELNERIKNDRFNLAVLGEFRRGKSTLINALLRTPVLPADIVPTTASVNRITYDPIPKAKVEYFDGKTASIPIEDLKDYATQEGEKSESVKEVTVWYPTTYCANNVDLYDTPGLNDSEEMTKATTDVISRMDVALFVLSANVNFSMSEAQFIGEKLLTADVGRVIFVVTRMDSYTPEEQAKILKVIRNRVEEMVWKKAEEVFADDPEKLAAFQNKLGSIQIFGVSSTQALEARRNHDPELLEKSGFAAFERAIDEMLTQERGRVMLDKQTGSILKTCADLFNAIQARLTPLTMDEDEFQASCKKIEAEIAKIKAAMDEEAQRLDVASETITAKAKTDWNGYVAEMKQAITEAAMALDIDKVSLKKQNKEKMTEAVWTEQIAPVISRKLQVYCERFQNEINDAVGKECEKMDGYVDKVSSGLTAISETFNLPKQAKGKYLPFLDTTLNMLTLGGGTLRAGYNIAGAKGALVGGLAGAGITTAGCYAAGVLLGLAGLTTWPFVLAGAALASVGGLVGGKAIVQKVFWKDRVDAFKKEIAAAACGELDNILKQEHFEATIIDHIHATFATIKAEMQRDTSGTLVDLQNTLRSVSENFAAEKAQAEQKVQTYTAILEDLSAMTERTRGVRAEYKLDEVAK